MSSGRKQKIDIGDSSIEKAKKSRFDQVSATCSKPNK